MAHRRIEGIVVGVVVLFLYGSLLWALPVLGRNGAGAGRDAGVFDPSAPVHARRRKAPPDAGGPSVRDAGTMTSARARAASASILAPPVPTGKVVGVGLKGDPASWPAKLRTAVVGLGPEDLLVVEMRSSGGDLRSVLSASKVLLRCPCRSLAFVDGPLLGTSVLVALSAEAIIVAPDARVGATDTTQLQAGSLDAKDGKRLLAAMEEAARRRKRPFGVVAAIVDSTKALDLDARPLSVGARGQVRGAAQGEFLSLGAKAARELGLADGTATTLNEIRRLVGVADRDMLFDGKVYGAIDRKGISGGRLPRARPVDPVALVAGVSKVYLVPIHGTIDLGLAPFVKRVLKNVGPTDVVVLDVDTFGGRVDAAVKIRDALLSSKAKTIAFVNRRAISAGALISLACDLIVMTPGASMGAATPVQISGGKMKPTDEKVVSYMRKEMKSTAEAKGRRGDIAEAMVDRDVEVEDLPDRFKEEISGLRKGKLLTMTTEEALKLGMADLEAADFSDLQKQLRIDGISVVRPRVNWAEKISRFLTDPIVSGLLLTIGMLGLLIELYTPGFGVAGILGLTCLVLFFFGHMIADLAGWGHLLLFGVGVLLLGLELFVIPGFGIAGISGIALILVSLIWAMSGLHTVPFRVAWNLGYLSRALAMVFGSVAATALLGFWAIRAMPKSRLFAPMFLKQQTGRGSRGADMEGHGALDDIDDWLPPRGTRGQAATLLRPAGKVRFGRVTISAMAEGDYVEKGKMVEVVRHEAGRVVVRSVDRGMSEETAPSHKDGAAGDATDESKEERG